MILADIRDYLRERGQVSLSDLALHFDSDPLAVRGMLDVWVRKGRVSKLQGGADCGGCNQCDSAANEIYQWTADGAVPLSGTNCSLVSPPVTVQRKI